jgi:hypothetical protein
MMRSTFCRLGKTNCKIFEKSYLTFPVKLPSSFRFLFAFFVSTSLGKSWLKGVPEWARDQTIFMDASDDEPVLVNWL